MPEPIEFDDQGHIVLKINWRVALKVVFCLLLAGAAALVPLPGLSKSAHICLVMFVGAAGFWITEVIPPFATAIMVIVTSIYVLGMPGGPLGLEATGVESSYQIFLNPIASPVLVLFFGGFILAVAASKHGLDVRLAKAFIKPFGTKPTVVLLGVITTTALFSMFMSNTATTAMMIAIVAPLFRHLEGRAGLKQALVLAVPFAANIGGMGTIIGTPPNAVAASVLLELGHPISFFRWMTIGVPLVIILLLALWMVLRLSLKIKPESLELLFPDTLAVTWDLVVVVCTFVVTILLWLTEPLHSLPAAVVALLPVGVFTVTGIIGREDLQKIEWHVLILVAGGLTLGVAMKASGLSDWLAAQLGLLEMPTAILLIVLALVAIALSNFMSNTSAANLLIPIVISLAAISPIVGAVAVAFAASLAMSLPISTPPNAIAFATRAIHTSDLARYGTIVSAVGVVLMLAVLLLFRTLGVIS
jgi:sodium-dependent dicarboxylate transporter 2/3/5